MSGALWQPVPTCGGLWQPVAACRNLWHGSRGPIRRLEDCIMESWSSRVLGTGGLEARMMRLRMMMMTIVKTPDFTDSTWMTGMLSDSDHLCMMMHDDDDDLHSSHFT